eukprot:710106_1
MSILKYEETQPISVILDQSNSAPSSIVKSEVVSPPQQHTSNFSCEYCDKDFNLKQYLIRHVLEIHGDTSTSDSVKPEQSPIESITPEAVGSADHFLYGVSISSKSAESNNLDRNYTDSIDVSEPKAFSCEVCQKTFSWESYLKSHMLVHSDVKPYSCEVCQKNFKRKACLKDHLVVHSDVKPYSCEICQKSFKRRSS